MARPASHAATQRHDVADAATQICNLPLSNLALKEAMALHSSEAAFNRSSPGLLPCLTRERWPSNEQNKLRCAAWQAAAALMPPAGRLQRRHRSSVRRANTQRANTQQRARALAEIAGAAIQRLLSIVPQRLCWSARAWGCAWGVNGWGGCTRPPRSRSQSPSRPKGRRPD